MTKRPYKLVKRHRRRKSSNRYLVVQTVEEVPSKEKGPRHLYVPDQEGSGLILLGNDGSSRLNNDSTVTYTL